DRVALRPQAGRVRVVAVGAGDALGIHSRLQERAVLVDLVEDLAVGVVEPGAQLREVVGVCVGRAGQGVARAVRLAPRVAAGALLDRGLGAVKAHGQADVTPTAPGPGDMGCARSVARLAADADLDLGRGIAARRRVVALVVAGRVA